MAAEFEVEDGTGSTSATSYLSVADLKQLWDNAGYDYSSLSDAQIQVLLNNGTSSLDGRYGERWPGLRASKTQALDWPREEAYDRDGFERSSTLVPPEVEKALSELVYAVNSGTNVDPENTETGVLQSESVRVEGAVSESKTYFQGSQKKYPDIPKVSNALRRLLGSSSAYGPRKVVRV
jgi:hypothetical protein